MVLNGEQIELKEELFLAGLFFPQRKFLNKVYPPTGRFSKKKEKKKKKNKEEKE